MKNDNSGLISFGGFPRSGNHTLGRVLSFAFPKREIHWLIHRITEIGSSENCVISVRNPLESVGSWIEFRKDYSENNADKYLEWFCRYFEKVYNCSESLAIISLEDLMHFPYDCASSVSEKFNLEPSALVKKEEVEQWLLYNTPMHIPNAISLNKNKWFEKIKSSSFYEKSDELFNSVLKKKMQIGAN
jgi:hypothetical protein